MSLSLKNETNQPAKDFSATLTHFAHSEYCFSVYVIVKVVKAELGYVLGFIFYWLVWCFFVPLLMLKREGFISLFKEKNPLFRKSNWLPAGLFVLIVIITVIMYPLTSLVNVQAKLLIIAIQWPLSMG